MINAAMMEMPGSDEWFMRQAMKEARKALARGEVPIGAVVVRDGHVIARGWNQVETLKDATAHAEMIALTAAQEALGDWRLEGCTLYVTKEPCPMCAGAIINSRIEKVTFGAYDEKNGAAGSKINLFEVPFTFRTEYEGGVMEEACRRILSDFFLKLREKRKEEKQ